ncbi:MAG: hypothetical protein JXA46_09130 [Dehalococcoidales bacterium]|nr:hypothetical protein [Dehalococcoidales bacterium]
MFNLRMPSLGAILHFLLLEAVSQLLWWLVSKMITITSVIRDVGFLVVFVAVIFAVAWYLPKLSPTFWSNNSKKASDSKKSINPYQETINSMSKDLSIMTDEVSAHRELLKSQQGHEEQWLRPVIEWIDFNRESLSPKEVMLKYGIDSGLVYDFKPYRMWIKLKIGQYEPKDGWEILQPPNLLKGKRNEFASDIFTIIDDRLLKRVVKCRQGVKVAQTLIIIVQLRDREGLRVLESSYSINQYSEYSQELEQ